MSLKEFIFIDTPRLDMYVQQISSPMKREKIPHWEASLSLVGPSAKATQSIETRSHTVSEKIHILVDYLRKENLLAESAKALIGDDWPYADGSEIQQFAIDERVATKVRVPMKQEKSPIQREITLWLSRSPVTEHTLPFTPHDGFLCLMEDYRGPDEELYGGFADSGYSVLQAIVFALREDLDKTVLGGHFPPPGRLGRRREILTWLDALHRIPERRLLTFIRSPAITLRQMGCVVYQPRRIRSLFRVRDISPQRDRSPRSFSIFGYPIYIVAT